MIKNRSGKGGVPTGGNTGGIGGGHTGKMGKSDTEFSAENAVKEEKKTKEITMVSGALTLHTIKGM
jgi:hypothetical protein